MRSFGRTIFLTTAGVALLFTLIVLLPSTHCQSSLPSLKCYACGRQAILDYEAGPKSRTISTLVTFLNMTVMSEEAKKYDHALNSSCNGTNSKGTLLDCAEIVKLTTFASGESREPIEITLFSEKNHKGESHKVTVTRAKCTNLPDFDKQTSSIGDGTREGDNTLNACIKLWDHADCRGKTAELQGSTARFNLRDFAKKASAVSLCSYNTFSCVEVKTRDGEYGRGCDVSQSLSSILTGNFGKISYCYTDSCNFDSIPDPNKVPVSSAENSRVGWELSAVLGVVGLFRLNPHL